MMNNSDLLKDFSTSLKQSGKQPSTVESYRRDVDRYLQFLQEQKCPIHNTEPGTLTYYQSHLDEICHGSRNSIRRAIIAIRQFYRYLEDTRFIDASPLEHVPIPSRDETLPEQLENADVENILKHIQKSPSSLKTIRDAAIISLLAYEGIKAGEMITLSWNDYLEDKGLTTIKISGSRKRILRLGEKSSKFLYLYEQQYRQSIPVQPSQKIFIAFKNRDLHSPALQISRHGLKFLLYELGQECGIPKLNTEMLRHHAIQYFLYLGKTPEDIMHHFGLKRLGNIAKHAF